MASSVAGLLSLTLDVYRRVLLAKQAVKGVEDELLLINGLLVGIQATILNPELSPLVLRLDAKIHDLAELLESLRLIYSRRPSATFLRKLQGAVKGPRIVKLVERNIYELRKCCVGLEIVAVHFMRFVPLLNFLPCLCPAHERL